MHLIFLFFSFALALPHAKIEDNQTLDNKHALDILNNLNPKIQGDGQVNGKTLGTLIEIYKGGILAGLTLLEEAMNRKPKKSPISSEEFSNEVEITTARINTTTVKIPEVDTFKPNNDNVKMKLLANSSEFDNQLQRGNELDGDVEEIETIKGSAELTTRKNIYSESQEEESSEEDNGLVGGLVKTFLGGLSKPDGGIDLDAIVGLIGGLSVQRDDGTFDFNGLTELLRGFFGGEQEEGGGGSDVGQFLGGLLAAIIQGSAKPPGAKGAGIFTGNVITGILPGLSAPAPPPEDAENQKPAQGLDSGGFLAGLVSSVLGGSSSSSSSSGAKPSSGGPNPIIQLKQTILRGLLKIISSVLGASSSSSSGKKM